MDWRNRWTFWATAVAVLALISVPSTEWVSALREYARFVRGWEPAPLKPSATSFTPRESPQAPPELRPVEFRHRAPRARSVELVGDFNAWKPRLLKMKRADGGLWTLVVPLLPGAHKYLFLDDGRPTLDPAAPAADGPGGRRVSVIRAE